MLEQTEREQRIAALQPVVHAAVVGLAKAVELVRSVDRQRANQQTVDEGENRDIRAKPERERQDRRGREPGLLSQRARGVAQILPEIAERETGWARPV